MKQRYREPEKLFHQYRDKVFGFFVDFLNNRELSKDLTQDIFLKLLQQEDTLSLIQDKDGYIYQMCRNLAFDHLKKAAHQKKYRAYILSCQNTTEAAIDPAIDQKMNTDHYRLVLDQYLSKLPDQQRLIFNLSKKEGLSHKKIAAKLNISPHTVRNHLAQAMKNIRSEISPSDMEMMMVFSAVLWLV